MSYFSYSLWNRAHGGFLPSFGVGALVTAVINTEVLILLVNKNSCWAKKGKVGYFVSRNLHGAL